MGQSAPNQHAVAVLRKLIPMCLPDEGKVWALLIFLNCSLWGKNLVHVP